MDRKEIVERLNEVTFQFKNKTAKIGKRTQIKKGQNVLYAYFPSEKIPAFRNLSSLYWTEKDNILALEYKKRHYVFDIETLSVNDDTFGLYNRSKAVPQGL